MSIVIIGGNECMEYQYRALCRAHGHRAKVFTRMQTTLRRQIGEPDMMIFFTNTVSHKMIQCAMAEVRGKSTIIERCHSSSASALKSILARYPL